MITKKRLALVLVIFCFLLFIGIFIYPIFLREFSHKPSFTDIFKSAQIKRQRIAAGASWGDYDNDGNLDLFLGGRTKLYHNDGNQTFLDVTDSSNLEIHSPYSLSGIFADYDNDGCQDLFVVGAGEISSILYKGGCKGDFAKTFEIKDPIKITNDGYKVIAAVWGDYDNDGYLDLYLAQHGIFISQANLKTDYYSLSNNLYHNNRDGTFTDVTIKAGVNGASNCGLAPLKLSRFFTEKTAEKNKRSFQPVWFDYNNDGRLDLFVATDGAVSPLYKNNGNGTFIEVTKETGLCRYGSNMGVAIADYDNDGDLDLYTTNEGANYFWSNNGDGTFSEKAAETGTADYTSLGWGTGFLDYNNDSNLDLFVVNGIMAEERPNIPIDFTESQKDRLFKNDGSGHFTDFAQKEGVVGNYQKETAAFADFNNDGFEDIFVASSIRLKKDLRRLYKNTPNGNHWLTLQLVGTKSNRDSVGARIWVTTGDKTQMREIISGSSYLSQNSLWQTFGLGKTNKIDKIKIRWPSGTIRTLYNVKVNQKLRVEEE